MSLRARLLAVLAVALAGSAWFAQAQPFPDHAIRVVVPYPPGGGTDILVRAIQQDVGAALGQPVMVENRPGGASVVGTEMVARAAPDGYTVLAMDSAILVNPGLLRGRLPYDTARQLTGVTMVASGPVVLLLHPSVPATDLASLIALAKAKPGSLNFASGGNGASTHLAGVLFGQVAGIEIVHVPYKGTAPALNDLLAGQVQMMFGGISSARPFIEAGKLRAVALSATHRNPAMPDVPTFSDEGLHLDVESYWGLYAPAGTPPEVVARLNAAVVRALRQPRTVARLAELGFEIIGNTPAEHTAQFRAMIADWTAVIEKTGVRLD